MTTPVQQQTAQAVDPMTTALVTYRETRSAFMSADGAHTQAEADVQAATAAASAKATDRAAAVTAFSTAIDELVEHLRAEKMGLSA